MSADLDKVAGELRQAQMRFASANTTIITHMAVLTVMKTEEANDVKIRATKAMIRGLQNYATGLIGISDQMGAEIKELNNGR